MDCWPFIRAEDASESFWHRDGRQDYEGGLMAGAVRKREKSRQRPLASPLDLR